MPFLGAGATPPDGFFPFAPGGGDGGGGWAAAAAAYYAYFAAFFYGSKSLKNTFIRACLPGFNTHSFSVPNDDS